MQVHRGGVYTKDNVQVANGTLQLRTIAQNITVPGGTTFYVSSGAVNTSGLFEQHTGRWEVSVKLPLVQNSPGYTLHSSIWLYENEREAGRIGCRQEIDVVEQVCDHCLPRCLWVDVLKFVSVFDRCFSEFVGCGQPSSFQASEREVCQHKLDTIVGRARSWGLDDCVDELHSGLDGQLDWHVGQRSTVRLPTFIAFVPDSRVALRALILHPSAVVTGTPTWP